MKVKKLIEMLEDCDPEAAVFIMSQSSYPFEVALYGVAVREEFTEYDEGDAEGVEASPTADRWATSDTKLPRSDVFIVEGSQIRYGSKDAWNAARRS